jgi:hypothetical protein
MVVPLMKAARRATLIQKVLRLVSILALALHVAD